VGLEFFLGGGVLFSFFFLNSDHNNTVLLEILRDVLPWIFFVLSCVYQNFILSHGLLSLGSLTGFPHTAVGLTVENVFILSLEIAVLCFSTTDKIQECKIDTVLIRRFLRTCAITV